MAAVDGSTHGDAQPLVGEKKAGKGWDGLVDKVMTDTERVSNTSNYHSSSTTLHPQAVSQSASC